MPTFSAVSCWLALLSLTAITLFSDIRVFAQCTAYAVRKEIRAMSPAERDAFVFAALKLERETGNNAHDWLTAVHVANQRTAHGTILFFPFHRWLQNEYQGQIARMDSSVAVPYWDWSADAANMGGSAVFASSVMGGSGGGPEMCIASGPFQGITRAMGVQGSPHCLSRAFNSGNTIDGIYDWMYMLNLVRYSRNFNDLWRGVENGPHSAVHYGIGGDMATMQSSNDPLFFMHHGFVDKLWDDWQRNNPNHMFDFGGDAEFNNQMANMVVPSSNGMRISSIINTQTPSAGCYVYQPSPFEVAVLLGATEHNNGTLTFVVTREEMDRLTNNSDLQRLRTNVLRQRAVKKKRLQELLALAAISNGGKSGTSDDSGGSAFNTTKLEDELKFGLSPERADLLRRDDAITFKTPTKIPVPNKLPEPMIDMLGLNVTDVRRQEIQAKHWIQAINSLILDGKMVYGETAPEHEILKATQRAEIEFTARLRANLL